MFFEHQTNNGIISEGSCDTDNWSNEAENSALPSEEYKLHFKTYSNRFFFILNCNNKNECLLYFYQINAALLSIMFQKH